MDKINLYVVLGAPPRGDLALVHHQEVEPNDYEQLCAEYEPDELDYAVVVVFERLDRVLNMASCGEPPEDGDGDELLSLAEASALRVLLGCLAVQTHEAVEAGNRWAVINVRYHDEEARITVACSCSAPEFEKPMRVGFA